MSAWLARDLRRRVEARLDAAAHEDVVARIWRRDPTVWGDPATPELGDRLGWLGARAEVAERLPDLERLAADARGAGIEWVVLLGMGGSSLAPEVLRRSFGDRPGAPRLRVLDSVVPGAVRALEREVGDLARVLFVVATKSGGTVETLSLYRWWAERAGEHGRFAAITDPGSSLERLAADRGFVWTQLGDPEVGGRFSALSPFGIVPAVLAGIDARRLLADAERGERACAAERTGAANAGLLLGVVMGEAALAGRDKLTLTIDPPLEALGLWIEQLVAESTGKAGRGVLPVDGEPPVPPGAYAPDRLFVDVAAGAARGPSERGGALLAHGHPLVGIAAEGPEPLGRLFFVLEFATAVAGWVLAVNPFDQPDVQDAKERTKTALAGGGGAQASDGDPARALAGLLDGARAPDYVGVLAYVPPSPEADDAAERLRRSIHARTGCATTFGYGPRYLHSTGQLHKGGPPGGRFLVLLEEADEELPVPGESWGLGTLAAAQAAADTEALRSRGLAAELVRVPAGGAARLLERLAAAVAPG